MTAMATRIMFTIRGRYLGTKLRGKRVAECSDRIRMTSASSRGISTDKGCCSNNRNRPNNRDTSNNNRGNSNTKFTPSRMYSRTRSQRIQFRGNQAHATSKRQDSLEAQSSKGLSSGTINLQYPSNCNSWTADHKHPYNNLLSKRRGSCTRVLQGSLSKPIRHQLCQIQPHKLDPWRIRHRVCSDSLVRKALHQGETEILWPK